MASTGVQLNLVGASHLEKQVPGKRESIGSACQRVSGAGGRIQAFVARNCVKARLDAAGGKPAEIGPPVCWKACLVVPSSDM